MISARVGVCIAGFTALVGWTAPSSPTAAILPTAPEGRIAQDSLAADFVLEGAVSQGGVVIGTAPEGATAVTLDGKAIPLDPERRFLIGFDRDAPPTSILKAAAADGHYVIKTLNVAPRAWRLEKIDASLRSTRDSEAFLAQRRPELARIAAARAIGSESRGWRQRFEWPVTGRISGLFGAQRIYRGEPGVYHSGVDVAVPTGTPVRAPADGAVILAANKPFTLEGKLLMIDHGAGLNSAFLHLSRIDVAERQQVRKGQIIGAVGATGRATGPHMHWGMKWKDTRIDPLLLVGDMEK